MRPAEVVYESDLIGGPESPAYFIVLIAALGFVAIIGSSRRGVKPGDARHGGP